MSSRRDGAAARRRPKSISRRSARRKGWGKASSSKLLVVLSALGGECIDDFDGLRRDMGLAAAGYTLPAASTAAPISGPLSRGSITRRAAGTGELHPAGVGRAGRVAGRCSKHSVRTYVSAVAPGPAVTLDVDAHLVESSKHEALWIAGFTGYQPLLVSWAEHGLCTTSSRRRRARWISRSWWTRRMQPAARSDGRAWQVSRAVDSAAYEQATLDHSAARGLAVRRITET